MKTSVVAVLVFGIFTSMHALGQQPDPAALVKEMQSKYLTNRQAAVEALVKMGEAAKPAVPLIVNACRETKNWQVHLCAAEALGKLGPVAVEAVPSLAEIMKQAQSQVDPLLFKLLGEVLKKIGPEGKKALGPVLLGALKPDVDIETFTYAAAEVGGLGPEVGKSAVPILAGVLKGKNIKTYRAAVEGLKKAGAEGKQVLASAFIETLKSDGDAEIFSCAVSEIAGLGADAKPAIPVLADIAKARNVKTFKGVCDALKKMGPEGQQAAAPALASALQTDVEPDLFNYAAGEISAFTNDLRKIGIPGLTAALQVRNPKTYQAAVSALERIGAEGKTAAIPGLLEGIKADNIDVFKISLGAIPKFGREAIDKAKPVVDLMSTGTNAAKAKVAADALAAWAKQAEKDAAPKPAP